jgi:hypothetical protein
VVVVGWRGRPASTPGDAPSGVVVADGRRAVERLVAEGVPRSEAARRVAAETGLSRRLLYRAASHEPPGPA